MGGKSGGGGRTPYESPDSLKSAQRLRALGLISLGPIRGAVTADKYESIFFDNTPLKNAQGEWNYQNTEINYNLGTQDQLPLSGFEMSEREVPVGAEVKYDHALSRSVIDPDITRLRISLGVNALFSQNDQGDTQGTSVEMQLLINNKVVQTITIDGKSSSRFHRSYILDNLPPKPFTLTVKRLTADSKSQRLQNSTFWSSYTEIIDTQLSYPNMAIVGIKTDSRYNPNFPNINFLLYGRLVKVPSNYDPDTRTYAAGLWQGDFKLAWTNNPAWVFYDLITHKLAGLGQRLGDYSVDKFQLYQIAQYCDQLVPDGYGGMEPRMTANLWITEQREAYQIISDMASVFRAIAVWNGVQYTAIQDRPSDPVYTYTQANVIEGKFNRQYAPLKSIFTAVEVEYADENNFYQKAIEYIADDSMIERYGYNVKKIVAFACTSRGQARRYGKWILETSRLEQCTISFSVGRDGLQVIPGDIIEIADKSYANLNLGGRVVAVSDRQVTLDAPIQIQGESYLSYLTDDKRLVRHKISQIDPQNPALITLDVPPTGLEPMALWTLHSPQVSTQRYRVLTITENDNGSYAITALQHIPQKEQIVDNGVVFEPTSERLYKVPSQLTYLGMTGTSSGGMRIAWESTSTNGILTYDIKVLKDGLLYLFKKGESSTAISLDDLPNGEYLVTIIARNAQGQIVSEKTESFTISRPPVPKNISVMGGLSEISLTWDYVDEVTKTEIWASPTNDLRTASCVAKVLASFYSHTVGANQTRYYWLRHTRGQNVGDFYQQQGLRGETGADIEAEMELLRTKLSKPIIDEVFDTAAPACGLELTKTVASLENPTVFQQSNLLFNLQDKKLYHWDGHQYQARVPSGDIDGLIPTTKLSGQLRDNQIASLSSAKLAGKVSKTQLDPTLLADVSQAQRAISQETQARTAALQQEVQARGNAITSLERINTEQTQKIQSVTAKAESALSGVQEERLARTRENQATANQIATLTAKFQIPDTRRDNRPPSWYWTNYPKQKVVEFKQLSTMGIKKSGFGSLETLVAWGDPSGNPITQILIDNTGIVYRRTSDVAYTGRGKSPTYTKDNWNAWVADETVLGSQAKADAVKAIAEAANQLAAQAIADIQAEQVARANAIEAISRKTDTLTAKMGTAESKVSQASEAVTRLNGTVQAMHTLRTETVAGGRKAIAGLSLGSTGGSESSIIFMADRTSFVKNSQDGSPKALLTIANGQMVN